METFIIILVEHVYHVLPYVCKQARKLSSFLPDCFLAF